jgi:hypothetical protein
MARFHPVARSVYRMALLLEGLLEEASDLRLVLDH